MKTMVMDRPEHAEHSAVFPRPKNILIVDDELKIRVLFRRVLSGEGYRTLAFGDNAYAIQYLRENVEKVDLLILDLDMPHVDGRYFCEMMRMRHPGSRVLIASNYALDVQKYMILDADDYYDKSEGIRVLKEKISRIFSEEDKRL